MAVEIYDSDTGTVVAGDTISGSALDIGGANRFLIAFVMFNNNYVEPIVQSITIDGNSLTKRGDVQLTDDSRVEIWSYSNPATGTGVSWSVVFDPAIPSRYGGGAYVACLTGVDIAGTPYGTFAESSGNGTAPYELTVNGATDDMYFGAMAMEATWELSIYSGNPATKLWNYTDSRQSSGIVANRSPSATSFIFQIDGDPDHWAFGGIAIKPLGITYKLEGISKDKNGDVLVSCKCYLFKDNQDDTLTYKDYALSDAGSGAYSFTGISDDDAQYIVVVWKDNTPHVFDTTDHVLQPVEE